MPNITTNHAITYTNTILSAALNKPMITKPITLFKGVIKLTVRTMSNWVKHKKNRSKHYKKIFLTQEIQT